MTKMFLVSICDKAAEAFNPPACVPALGIAERQFRDLLSDAGSAPGKHPGDFSLWHIGYFDDASAQIEMLSQPTKIAEGMQFVPPKIREVSSGGQSVG